MVPTLVPSSSEVDTAAALRPSIDPDLTRVVAAWQHLPGPIKAGIIPFSTGGGSIADVDQAMEMGCQWLFVSKDADYLQTAAAGTIEKFAETAGRKHIQASASGPKTSSKAK